ncbi:hypothetical protein AOLI_G00199880 [Acnodon oligacanthus]
MLVKEHVTSKLPPTFDPYQFAYRPNRSTEDAMSSHLSLEHLEGKNTHVRLLFLDFSSAFNTIIPQHLMSKLAPLGFSTHLSNWLLDFLTNGPQSVQVGNNISSVIPLSTGSPQGCVLSPLVFTLMTHDCSAWSTTNHIVKFADDTTVVALIQDDNDLHYREEEDPTQPHTALHQGHSSGHSQQNHVPGGTDDRHFDLVHSHWSSGQKSSAAHALPETDEKSTAPPSDPHHLLQRNCGEHTDQLGLCLGRSLGASDWTSLQTVVRTAEKVIGTSLPPIQDTAKSRCLTRA